MNDFNDYYMATIGIDLNHKKIIYEDKKINIQVWDTAGLEKFRSLTSNYYRGADVILLFFDTTVRSSFTNLPYWIDSISKKLVDHKIVDISLIGTKIDLEKIRKVSKEEAELFAKQHNLNYFEISASNLINELASADTDTIMKKIIKKIINNLKEETNINTIKLNQKPNTKLINCC